MYMHSRPLHGESIYLRNKQITGGKENDNSRPLHGESIYLRTMGATTELRTNILVPSTGNLYIYEKNN